MKNKDMPRQHPEIKSIYLNKWFLFASVTFSVILGSLLSPLAYIWVEDHIPFDKSQRIVEQFEINISPFAWSAENKGGTSSLRVVQEDTTNVYHFRYDLPGDQINSFAGLAFQFRSPQDLSSYQNIEFTIQFSEKDQTIELYLSDITNALSSIRIVSTTAEEMKFTYPLTDFKNINLNAIQEVTFFVDSAFVTGSHEIIVKNIRFVH